MAFLRLVEHLEHKHLWVRLQAQNGQKQRLSSETHQSILVLRNEGYSMREIAKKLKISYNAVCYSLHRTAQTGTNQNERGVGGPGAQLSKRTCTLVSSLRNRHLTSQLAASLNSTRKTPVSTSTVKRWLWNAGLLGKVAKSKRYLRLVFENEMIKMG